MNSYNTCRGKKESPFLIIETAVNYKGQTSTAKYIKGRFLGRVRARVILGSICLLL